MTPLAAPKGWLVRAGQLALTVGVTWLIVDRVGPGIGELRALDAGAWRPDPFRFALASLLLLLGYFVSGTLWGRIVHDLGGPRLPARTTVPLFMIANLGRYLPGKVWQIAGLAALAKGKGVPPAVATGAAVLGQGIALLAAATLGLGTLLTGPPAYRSWGLLGVGVATSLLLIVSVPAVFRRLASAWLRVAGTEGTLASGSLHGVRWLALYLVNWALYALAFWVLAESLGFSAELLPVASAFAAAYVLGYLMIFAPAGLGPREGFLIVFLTPHLGAAPSGMLALVARVWTTAVEVVPAGIFWIRRVATPAEHRPEGTP